MQMDRIWPSDLTRRIKTSATLRARFVVVTRAVVRNSRSSHRMVVRVPSDALAVAKTRGANGNALPKNRRPGLESPWKTGGNQPEDHRRGQSCEACIDRCGAARGLRPRTPIRWVSAGLARVDGPMAHKGPVGGVMARRRAARRRRRGGLVHHLPLGSPDHSL
jgi:hypothetical protein